MFHGTRYLPTSAAIQKILRSLFDIKPLTDAGLPVTLSQTASGITVVYKPVLHKPIDPATGLWRLSLQQPDTTALAVVLAFPNAALRQLHLCTTRGRSARTTVTYFLATSPTRLSFLFISCSGWRFRIINYNLLSFYNFTNIIKYI